MASPLPLTDREHALVGRAPARTTGYPTFVLGLNYFRCPLCGHDGQRLIRAQQFWRDQSDAFCPQIHVELDFCCQACEQGWRLHLFNEDEGEGEIILDVSLVETVNSEDAKAMAEVSGEPERS
jgi:hypothetical protein